MLWVDTGTAIGDPRPCSAFQLSWDPNGPRESGWTSRASQGLRGRKAKEGTRPGSQPPPQSRPSPAPLAHAAEQEAARATSPGGLHLHEALPRQPASRNQCSVPAATPQVILWRRLITRALGSSRARGLGPPPKQTSGEPLGLGVARGQAALRQVAGCGLRPQPTHEGLCVRGFSLCGPQQGPWPVTSRDGRISKAQARAPMHGRALAYQAQGAARPGLCV